jgi:DNA repair protein RadA/Sms
MARKTVYVCSECAHESPKWAGKCSACGSWNTLVETAPEPVRGDANRFTAWAGKSARRMSLGAVRAETVARITTDIAEFDRVLGGGLVRGSVTLLGGDPGIGKSTLLLQCAGQLASRLKVLYVAGEESPEQVALRAQRLGLGDANIELLAEIELEAVLAAMQDAHPEFVVIDSIQTLYSSQLQSAPGTVAQVRECAAHLTRFSKETGASLMLVGHVTKEGSLAGPRVLEHMVDTVLYFEGEPGSPFRMVRTFKNRFGSANEMGVFSMGAAGLEEVSNPSSLFLTAHERPVAGSCVLAALEGNRPFLVELQALAEDSLAPNPRRYSQGIELNRLQMLLAVLGKHVGAGAGEQNVYLKVVGGVRLTEPAADLAALLAIQSSLSGRPLPDGLVAFGEVGLAGELRTVAGAEARLREAAKLGFSHAIVPAGNVPAQHIAGLTVTGARRIDAVMPLLRSLREAA